MRNKKGHKPTHGFKKGHQYGKRFIKGEHPIDYNKKNCDPINLITLCLECHGKTNYKRDYWIEFFKSKRI